MTDIFNLPLSHQLIRPLTDRHGTVTPTLCMAHPPAKIRERRKKLFRALDEATDDREREKIATEILRLSDELAGNVGRRRRSEKRAKVAADPKEVKRQRRSVGVALASNPEESEMLIEINLADVSTEVLKAMLDDPVFADFKSDIEERIQRRESAGDEGGEEIAASFGRRVSSNSFIKHCEEAGEQLRRSRSC